MNKFRNIFLILTGLAFIVASCTKDLDTVPLDKDELTSAQVYEKPEAYKQILAKLYAGLAVSGQQGPAGMADISGIDEGFGQYLRGYWYHQELTTDEAVIGWNDQTIKDFHWQTWGPGDVFISAFYYRIFYQVALCNEFIRETTPEKLDSRNVEGQLRTDIETYRAEARFLRALSYYHALDLFGNVPFVTEEDEVGSFFPPQMNRADLFSYIEGELMAIEPLLVAARQNEYGRADKAAAWTLLAKLYLNAKVYTGVEKLNECVTYCQNIINAGYSLETNYEHLFLADNHLATNEVIFSVNFDGRRTQTYGGTTFLVHAPIGEKMVPLDYGVDDGWGGLRTTKAFVYKFYPDATSSLRITPIPPKKLKSTYPVIYVPGSHQGWDPANTATVLASVLSDGNYEGYLWFPANTEFKFTTGPNWDENYGDTGADGILDPGGDNIIAAEEGYYKINVNLNDLTFTFAKTHWGIIGSATAGGWDSDQDMTYDAATGMWTASLELSAGEMKFRANDGWDINLGDTGFDGILEYNGDNIAIAQAGTYSISMKLGVPDYTYVIERGSYDHRAMFFTDGQQLEIVEIGDFTNGWAITKWKNITRTGQNGSDLTHVDTDFPMFRLADVYLMYAEAVLRGATNGSTGDALTYVNLIRTRAFAGESNGNITGGQLTLDFILDERARELYWEGHRRTDLIRFGQFSNGTYVWPWKGKVPDGTQTSSHLDLFPLPSSDVGANPNLQQNSGY